MSKNYIYSNFDLDIQFYSSHLSEKLTLFRQAVQQSDKTLHVGSLMILLLNHWNFTGRETKTQEVKLST